MHIHLIWLCGVSFTPVGKKSKSGEESLEALDGKSPPFAYGAKDGAPFQDQGALFVRVQQ
jgi:hypothetical protein